MHSLSSRSPDDGNVEYWSTEGWEPGSSISICRSSSISGSCEDSRTRIAWPGSRKPHSRASRGSPLFSACNAPVHAGCSGIRAARRRPMPSVSMWSPRREMLKRLLDDLSATLSGLAGRKPGVEDPLSPPSHKRLGKLCQCKCTTCLLRRELDSTDVRHSGFSQGLLLERRPWNWKCWLRISGPRRPVLVLTFGRHENRCMHAPHHSSSAHSASMAHTLPGGARAGSARIKASSQRLYIQRFCRTESTVVTGNARSTVMITPS